MKTRAVCRQPTVVIPIPTKVCSSYSVFTAVYRGIRYYSVLPDIRYYLIIGIPIIPNIRYYLIIGIPEIPNIRYYLISGKPRYFNNLIFVRYILYRYYWWFIYYMSVNSTIDTQCCYRSSSTHTADCQWQ